MTVEAKPPVVALCLAWLEAERDRRTYSRQPRSHGAVEARGAQVGIGRAAEYLGLCTYGGALGKAFREALGGQIAPGPEALHEGAAAMAAWLKEHHP